MSLGAGIALGLLYAWGLRLWPAVLIATLGAACIRLLVSKPFTSVGPKNSLRILAAIIFGAIAASAVSSIELVGHGASHQLMRNTFLSNLMLFMVGGIVGTPVVLTMWEMKWRWPTKSQVSEITIAVIAIAVLGWRAYLTPIAAEKTSNFTFPEYLLFFFQPLVVRLLWLPSGHGCNMPFVFSFCSHGLLRNVSWNWPIRLKSLEPSQRRFTTNHHHRWRNRVFVKRDSDRAKAVDGRLQTKSKGHPRVLTHEAYKLDGRNGSPACTPVATTIGSHRELCHGLSFTIEQRQHGDRRT